MIYSFLIAASTGSAEKVYAGVTTVAPIRILSEDTVNKNTEFEFRQREDGTYQLTHVTAPNDEVTVRIPESYKGRKVTDIGSFALSDCPNIEKVIIPYGVIAVEERAFENCSKLSSILIPKSLIKISNNAFTGTKWLENQKKESPFVIINHILIDGTSAEGEITVPDGVTTIAEYAFFADSDITSVTLPDSVITIDWAAFYSCTNLHHITFSNSLTKIGTSVFEGCKKLSDIVIPASVKSIGGNAFSETTWLTDQQNENPMVILNGILINGTTAEDNVTLPDDVTSIADNAFSNSNITGITFPKGITGIGEYAFSGCKKLTEIRIPDSVTLIGSYALMDVVS
jgi:hypothetical protein